VWDFGRTTGDESVSKRINWPALLAVARPQCPHLAIRIIGDRDALAVCATLKFEKRGGRILCVKWEACAGGFGGRGIAIDVHWTSSMWCTVPVSKFFTMKHRDASLCASDIMKTAFPITQFSATRSHFNPRTGTHET
jgi:hypothetical protein